ncbi:cilia- and flagella-associated protein 46-like [Haliotis cracherodii]|uniref:cilia- and flagella-associated protein 46-like n=1 Tax=Haliotis cracherodii TaxID=6455 RepID=UPI0039ECD76F
MDTSIRKLLVSAQKYAGTERNPKLTQAYNLLRNVAETRPAVDTPEPFGCDLYVLCAEIAFQNGSPDMAKECLKMFFMKPPPPNQFLCRAYLCQAQLLAPQNANNPEKLEKAVVYLLKAISFAKKTSRYHFLVYNASVLYWQFCRPFLKPNFRQYLARSLHQVVKALDDIEDKDYEWRAQLMIALIECHLDAGRRGDASHIATAAASFIKQNVPSLYKQVFGLMVRHQLVESAKIHKDVKNSPELSIYYKICKIKVSLDQGEQKEYYSEIQSILNQLGVPHSLPTGRLARYDSRISVSGRPRSPSTSPTGKEEDVPKDRKSPGKGGRRTPTPTTSKKIAVDSADKPYLLLELGRMCLDQDFGDLGDACVEHTKTCVVKEQGFYLELEFLQCELMVKCLGEKQESYHKSAVEVRQQAIKRCEEAIMNAIRQGDPNILQAGCVTQWNLCLPLLQHNLRQTVRKPLTLLAEALEDIQSLLILLRCQVHTELAKCEEDREQIQVAMEHLRKALELDDGGVYRERLEVSLHRLELRSELYKAPERPEDQAAMIIEQARTADSGTIRMKRSLLVKAGEALAPDAFLLVLDSESDTKDIAGGKGPLTVIRQLSGKARQFTKCVKKAEGHLKRLGDENERERARLWADLAKTARKQEVWDVCRVASRFCILYDDSRWRTAPLVKTESPKQERSRTAERESRDEVPIEKTGSRLGSRPTTPVSVSLYDKDLIRILAEVNFIQGEAMVHLLRSEGVQLNDKPIPPEDKSKHPKGYVAKKPEEDPEWIEYCDWINSLSECATNSFLRGLALGMELDEPWLVCSGAAYVWNYNNHVFTQDRHREVIDTLSTILSGLKAVGHAGETMMLVNICNALSTGLIKPWIPEPPPREGYEGTMSPTPGDKSPSKSKGKSAVTGNKSKTPYTVTISPDAMPDLKKAIEVCEYVIQVTRGDNPQDVVPISVRLPLLQTWVFAKQMAQLQISKTLGTDDDHNNEGQRPMTRAIVATEMLCLSKNGILEFKETPFIGDIVQMVEDCKWSDKFIELQIWSRLTYQAYLIKHHNLVMRCSKHALKFAVGGTAPKGKKLEAHRYMVEQEMLSYASGLQGQSLIENMGGKNLLRREAMEAFLNSSRFARNANNYELVMTAARHYWNACLPLVGQPIERELLKEPIRVILQCITATAEKPQKKEDKIDGKGEVQEQKEVEVKDQEVKDNKDVKDTKDTKDTKDKKAGMIGNPEEDLTLRAALYGVLFQSYTDMGEWEMALQSMDQAVNDMPRTKHRLLIFKHRVMVKAKLGRPVHMDIQKFKLYLHEDESEDYVAHMWRRVALSSKETIEQMSSYQYAVEALNSPSNEWLKVDYLIEFGQWLYVNDFPLQDTIDQIEWAIDILLNIQAGGDKQEVAGEKVAAQKGDTKKGQMKAKREKKKPGKSSAKGKTGRKSPEGGKKTPDTLSKMSDGRSDISDSDSEINPADYIPVVKQAEIGVLPANPALTISDLTDIGQLDALIRAHVVLADVHGRNSPAYADICLMAHGYFMQLWKVCMSAAAPVMKELAKNPPPEANAAAGKKSANAKKDKKDKEVPKEKPKRKGPLDALPSTTEEWAVYDAPDEVLEAFKQETLSKTGITTETLQKPMLTLEYLDALMKMLQQLGYTHLSLPILAFQDMLSRSILPNNALQVLVHVRSIEVCQQLDLKAGVTFHDKIISPIQISEEDQAQSREEIAFMKEKQTQVAREEMRVKATLAQLAHEAHAQKRGPTPRTPGFSREKLEEVHETESHLGKILGAVTFRDIWADTAEVLIRQGLYSRARVFLNEAIIAAKEFKDKPLEARILYLLARLSYEEAQYGQAVNLCRMAQDTHGGDEMFWYKTTVLIVDATLHDYENRQARRAARKILLHSLNEFTQVYEERPNRMNVTGYILADLEGRLACVQADILLKEHKNVNNPQIMKGVLSACEKFENATEKLLQLQYKEEALPLMKKHASILRHLAREALEKDVAHTYYLQSVMVLREAASLAEEVYVDVQTLFGLQETRNLSLPVQREFVDIQIELGDVLTEILHVQAKESRLQQLEDQRKGSVLKMVEDLIRQTPTYTHMEKEWEESKQNCADEAVSSLLSAHSLCGNISHLRARALCILGKCLHIQAQHAGPDPPPHWLVQEMDLLKLPTEGGEEGQKEEGGKDGSNELQDRHHHKYAMQIKKMKSQHAVSKYYLSQATECLTQCLNLCLANKYTDLAGVVSLELVDCCGQFDAAAASNFLALHQSCSASQNMQSILYRSQLDPVTSRLAALLHQRQNLLSSDIKTNLANSPLMESLEASLEQDWQAWKRIEVLPNHLELLKEFPPNFNFVVLQHSPDKTFLYGALLDKLNKPVPTGGKPNPKQMAAARAAAAAAQSRARVFGVDTSPHQLEELISKFRLHKQNFQQMLLKQEYQRTQAALRSRMLENLEDGMKQQDARPQSEGEAEMEQERLQDEFRDLVAAMDEYLKPIMAPIDTALRSPQTPQSGVYLSKEPKVEVPPSQECVIILADPDLLEMPLEALDCLKADDIYSLSRDFSLQVFYHRFHQEQPIVEESAADKKKKKVDVSPVVSRIPGAREAKQKQAKIIPLDRKLEAWQQPVDTMNFKFIVDPQVDCPETEEHKPVEQFSKVVEEHEQQFTPRWLGLTGEEHTPSVGEWEIYMTESSAFVFYGMERLMSYLPPAKLSALNIPDCLLVYLLDMAQTSKSFLRQSKVDVLKSHNNLALEKPVETAMLVTMSGVKCLMANQWHCTLAENSNKLHISMKDLLEKGRSTGETVRLLFSPLKRQQQEAAAAAQLEAESVAAESQKVEGGARRESVAQKGDAHRGKDTESIKGGKKASPRTESRPGSKEEITEGVDDPDKDKEEPKEEEELVVQRDWFNMVCYGLPNLIVSQV